MSTIEEALARARLDRPYFARGLAALHPVAVPGLPTTAVDRFWRLYYGPESIAKWSNAEAATLVLHELEHVRRKHAQRSDQIPGLEHQRWNWAGDAEINDDLVITERLPVPMPGILPKSLGMKNGLLAEDYYHGMKTQKISVAICDGGSGAGVPRDFEQQAPGKEGAPPGITEVEQRSLIRGIAEDIQRQAGKQPGSVPAELVRWADLELAPPKLPWQQILAAEVRRGVALAAGRVDYSFNRMSRRQGRREVRLPASVRPVPSVAIVLDTSGSMGDQEGRLALGEIAGVCQAVGADVLAISCDAEASKPRRIRQAKGFAAVGGGGTDMGIGIAAAERARVDLVVVLTDGETPWPTKRPRARVVVCLVAEPGDEPPEWARVVRVAA